MRQNSMVFDYLFNWFLLWFLFFYFLITIIIIVTKYIYSHIPNKDYSLAENICAMLCECCDIFRKPYRKTFARKCRSLALSLCYISYSKYFFFAKEVYIPIFFGMVLFSVASIYSIKSNIVSDIADKILQQRHFAQCLLGYFFNTNFYNKAAMVIINSSFILKYCVHSN